MRAKATNETPPPITYGFYKKREVEKEQAKSIFFEQKLKKKAETEVDKEVAFFRKIKSEFSKVGEKKQVL